MKTKTIQPRRWLRALLYGAAIASHALYLLSSSSHAQSVPALINYQGQLTDAEGKALPTADYILTFSIHDAEIGGGMVWGPQIFDGNVGLGHGPKIPVVQGYFNVMLGEQDTGGRSLANAFDAASRFIAITVSDRPPISPRQRLLSGPFAFKAGNADKLAGYDWGSLLSANDPINGQLSGAKLADGSVTTAKLLDGSVVQNKIADGSITAAKIGPLAITATQVADGAITSAKLAANSVSSGNILDGTISVADIASGAMVKSLNSLKDDVSIVAGSNISLATVGNAIRINSSGWRVVDATNVTTSSIASFTELSPDTYYQLDFMLQWSGTAGRPLLRFNADSANHYAWAIHSANGVGAGTSGNSAANAIYLVTTLDAVKVNESVSGRFTFRTRPNSTSSVAGHGTGSYFDQFDGFFTVYVVGGRFLGSAPMTSVQLQSDFGTFTGQITLTQLSP